MIFKASNTTIFASAPRESVKTQCLTEISQNETLRNMYENGESIAKKILDVACPDECSNHGVCMEGKYLYLYPSFDFKKLLHPRSSFV